MIINYYSPKKNELCEAHLVKGGKSYSEQENMVQKFTKIRCERNENDMGIGIGQVLPHTYCNLKLTLQKCFSV